MSKSMDRLKMFFRAFGGVRKFFIGLAVTIAALWVVIEGFIKMSYSFWRVLGFMWTYVFG